MSKAFSPLWYYLCCNLAAYIIHLSNIFDTGSALYLAPTDVNSWFSLSLFVSLAAGGAITGAISLLTKQGVNASYTLLIWAVGSLLPIAQWAIAGVPLMLGLILPAELWFITAIVETLFLVLFFFFFVEIVTQRQIT